MTITAEALAAVEQADAVAYAEATRAGWTESEVKQVGFPPPGRRPPGRPRRPRRTPASDENDG